MGNTECAYCERGERLAKFAYEICTLPSSTVFLFREQSHPGRCVVAFHRHVADLSEILPQERAQFLEDCVFVSKVLSSIYKPDKINYGVFGDKGGHMHMHLVPKYLDGYEWGKTFEMNPKLISFTDEKCEEAAKLIRSEIEAQRIV